MSMPHVGHEEMDGILVWVTDPVWAGQPAWSCGPLADVPMRSPCPSGGWGCCLGCT